MTPVDDVPVHVVPVDVVPVDVVPVDDVPIHMVPVDVVPVHVQCRGKLVTAHLHQHPQHPIGRSSSLTSVRRKRRNKCSSDIDLATALGGIAHPRQMRRCLHEQRLHLVRVEVLPLSHQESGSTSSNTRRR